MFQLSGGAGVQLEGYAVEVVVVGEDCALPPPLGIAGRRGLAGTLLVLKVRGFKRAWRHPNPNPNPDPNPGRIGLV